MVSKPDILESLKGAFAMVEHLRERRQKSDIDAIVCTRRSFEAMKVSCKTVSGEHDQLFGIPIHVEETVQGAKEKQFYLLAQGKSVGLFIENGDAEACQWEFTTARLNLPTDWWKF